MYIILNLMGKYFERLKGCNSAPLINVIGVNPYFADLLEPLEYGYMCIKGGCNYGKQCGSQKIQ